MQPGVAALFAVAGRDPRQASAGDFGFAIGPRLNAAGRLADMTLGIECLLSDDPARATELATLLDTINRERRTLEAGMREDAEKQVDRAFALTGEIEPALAVFDPSFHEGVVGIIAARLKDRLHRPSFVFALGQDGALKGSGRSIDGFHLRDALDLVSKRHPGLLVRFGGHAMAAGCTIARADFETFRGALQQTAIEGLGVSGAERTIFSDGPLGSEHFDPTTARLLDDQVWGAAFDALAERRSRERDALETHARRAKTATEFSSPRPVVTHESVTLRSPERGLDPIPLSRPSESAPARQPAPHHDPVYGSQSTPTRVPMCNAWSSGVLEVAG